MNQKLKLLVIVDDEPLLLDHLGEIFLNYCEEVTCFSNPIDAQDFIITH